MFANILLKGILIGFLASVPLGPVSILIIQRTINKNRLTGFFSGIGAALSDTIYASIAGFSVAMIIEFVRQNELYFKIFGSLVLMALGVLILLSHPEKYAEKNNQQKSKFGKNLIGTFLITITNPLIIFIHLAIFTGFDVVLKMEKPFTAIFLITGFLCGAVLWWFTITGIVSLFRNRFSLNLCIWVNRIAGSAIIIIVMVTFIISLYH